MIAHAIRSGHKTPKKYPNVAHDIVIVRPFAEVLSQYITGKFFRKEMIEDGLENNRNCLQSWVTG